MIGTVIKSTGSWYEVRVENHDVKRSRLKGVFKLEGKKITNPIAVGDKVVLEEEKSGDDTFLIKEILPRENYVVRKAIKKTDHSHIIAANVDQVVVMATLGKPRTSMGFIDRILVTAETYRIPAIIIWNKQDLLREKDIDEVIYYMHLYQSVGYSSRLISAHKEDDVKALLPDFMGKINLVMGHSGVGKSTLLNQLIPDLKQRTSEISSFANKGVHTTTFAEMFSIDKNSYIIDTPGIKELGLSEVSDEELGHYFPEMRALLGECKFNNCTHIHEPKCAVFAAVEEGKISESRYLSYLSMFQEEDTHR